jgi:hypothetical protein
VARVLDCNVLEQRFVRPADFDLAAYWLGAEAEVLAPAELRDKMAELTQAMAARYQTAPDSYQTGKDFRRSRATKHS